MRPAPASVDQYLLEVESVAAKEALERIRAIIQEVIPEAEEDISYGMPMVKLHGMVIGFAAFKKHCSIFPGHTVADFAAELKGFKISKGTVQFVPAKPISEDLIRRMVRARAKRISKHIC